ncbi:MAG TPA: hypothetical protein VGH95_01045 [Candidatus Aquirickettsiella sp.]|jgi:hypothetical protein
MEENKAKKNDEKIVYASKKEVQRATKKCLKKYREVFKELAKR